MSYHKSVEIILVAVQIVVGGVETARAFEQLYLRHGTKFAEHADGLLGGGLKAVDGQGGINDLLHALVQGMHVVRRDGGLTLPFLLSSLLFIDIHVVAVGDGNVDDHTAGRPQVVSGLGEHEEERARIATQAAGRAYVEELHLFLLVDAEVHALHLIIHTCAHREIVHLEACLPIELLDVAT